MKKGYLTTSDRARIYYEDRGQGEPILFVPGHMCTVRFFDKNAELLEKKHRVITMDPRGFGNSSKVLQGNTIERHAQDISELLDLLDLKHVTLLGWSMSGSTVVTYAYRYGESRLKAVGILDAALFPFSSGDWNAYSARGYNMEEWNEKYGLWVTEPDVYYDNFVKRLSCGLKEEELKLIRSEIKKTPPWIGFALHTDWCHTNAEALLPSLTVPVFLAFGELTEGKSSMGRHYMEKIKTYRELHEFERGGHVFFWVDRQHFNEVLENFLDHLDVGNSQGESERRAKG